MVGRLSVATGEPVADIKRAWEQKESGCRPPPLTRRPIADQPSVQAIEPVYSPNYNGNTKAANERRRAAKEPVAGKRTCNRCGELKDKSDFYVSPSRTGSSDRTARTARGLTAMNAT